MPQGVEKPGWPQGSRKLGRARDRSSFYLEVYRLDIVPYGIMASEVKQLMFSATGTSDKYFDLSSALTAANRKQYHQFTRKGKPYCFDITIEHLVGSAAGNVLQWHGAPNNWTTRNAAVKMSAAWKHQLKEAGIRMRDLSKYGRRLRLPLDEGMSASGTGSMNATFAPQGSKASDGTVIELFGEYTTPSDEAVNYDNANEFTRVAIPDEAGAGDSVEMNLALYGYSDAVGADNYFGVVDEYLSSRGGVTDEPDSGKQTPDPLNMLQSMFSSTQPSTDEVIQAVEDYQDFRPYADGENDATATPPTASTLADTLQDFGSTAASYSPTGSAGTSSFSGPSSVIHMSCPLGLLKVLGADNKDKFKITVHSIYEM